MPIREISWRNFRAFPDTGWLEIRPLTVIVGANNSGKSSILDPLLLLKQTLRSKRAQSALVLRGEFVNAGSFSDIAYQHDNTSLVTFGIRFHQRHQTPAEVPPLGAAAPAVCEVTFRAAAAPGVVTLYRYAVLDLFDRPLVIRTLRSGQRYTLGALDSWAADRTDDEAREEPSDIAARRALSSARPNHFLFDIDPIWDAALGAAAVRGSAAADDDERLSEVRPIRLSSFVTSYSSAIDYTRDDIRDSLDKLYFIGPLREDPKRIYQISGDAPPDVGVRGEFSPEILLRNRRRPLFNQVNTWLRRFDFPGQLQCEESIDNTFKLVLSKVGMPPTNFADVGFGFSQLLPLLVQGLTAPKNSLIMTEQPEIHLNPRLQARLAEFFVEVIGRGPSIVLETHSEHLILGIRRLIAERKLAASDVAIYFAEASEEGSTIRRVEIQDNGHIGADDWPKGFFEDSLREAFAIAAAQARRD